MKMLRWSSKREVQGELAETEREAHIPVLLSDTLLPKLLSGILRAGEGD